MAAMASPGGMIPEQVWDSAAIPARRLFPGRPSGSAMPLAWAHAEFIKLMVSRQIGYPFDRPRAAWARYKGRRRLAQREFWWPHAPIASFRAGARLVIALPEAATVRWGLNGWNDATEQPTADTRLGFHAVTLDLPHLSPGARVDFTWRLTRTGDWHGHDYVATAAEDRSGSSWR
jgi:glucoamylase